MELTAMRISRPPRSGSGQRANQRLCAFAKDEGVVRERVYLLAQAELSQPVIIGAGAQHKGAGIHDEAALGKRLDAAADAPLDLDEGVAQAWTCPVGNRRPVR